MTTDEQAEAPAWGMRVRQQAPTVVYWGCCALVVLYRVVLCFQVPTHGADVLRHLGMTSHLGEVGWRFYDYIGNDFTPEAWTDIWGALHYFYPPVCTLFFALFSVFKLGIVPVKLVLTAIEVLNAAIFGRRFSRWAGLVLLANPVSVFYVSHEGQFEPLQTLFIILTAVAVLDRRWLLSGLLLSLSFQVKLFGLLLAPWMLEQILRQSNRRARDLGRAAVGFAAGVVPFIGFYLQTPALLLAAAGGNGFRFNPFYWDPFDRRFFDWIPMWLGGWMSGFSWAVLLVAALAAVRFAVKRESYSEFLPLIGFWIPVKWIAWAEFWYLIVPPGFLFCFLQRRRLVWTLLLLHVVICARSFLLLTGGGHFGYQEPDYRLEMMQRCMIRCDVRVAAAAP